MPQPSPNVSFFIIMFASIGLTLGLALIGHGGIVSDNLKTYRRGLAIMVVGLVVTLASMLALVLA